MVDIRLISILPIQTGVQQTTAPQGVTTQSPSISVNLPAGSILSGFIVNRDPTGNPILRSDKGDIVFSTNFFLKIGSEVVIRIEHLGGANRAHILSVNGQPPAVAEQQSAFAEEPEVILGRDAKPQQQQAAQSASSAVIRQAPEAVTVTGTFAPAPGKPAPAALPEGTPLTLKIITIAAAPPQETPAPATANQTSYSAYAKTVATPNATPATVPTATTAPVATSESAATPNPLIKGETFQATVAGREPSGEVVVQTQAGSVRLPPQTALPPGARVTFEVVNIGSPPTHPAPGISSTTPAPLTELARQWPALQEIVSLLTGATQTSVAPPVNALPYLLKPDAQTATVPAQNMPVGLMLFVAALRGGDFRNWLGADSVRWLETNGNEALLKRAEGDFAALSRPFTQAAPGQWQPVFFPLVVAGQAEQVRLFVKRDGKKKSGEERAKKGETTRFVVEMSLTQLGEMQMDGFVRQREQAMEFDLFIRSLTPLAPEIERDILAIYTKTAELTGYTGQLLFQAVREFPVHPMEELIADQNKSVIA